MFSSNIVLKTEITGAEKNSWDSMLLMLPRAHCNQFTCCISRRSPARMYTAESKNIWRLRSKQGRVPFQFNPLCTPNVARRGEILSWKRKPWRQELITKINTLFSSVSSLVFVQSFSCMNTGEVLFSSFERIVCVVEDKSWVGSPGLPRATLTKCFQATSFSSCKKPGNKRHEP